jgi:regulatory protein
MRSELELRDKLTAKKYDAQVIEELIAYFKNLGYINDREFAASWMNARLNKPLGLKIIQSELKQKGIDSRIIDELSGEKRRTLKESAIVEELASRKYNRLMEKGEPSDRIRRKLYAYLTRRGFSCDVVVETINRLRKVDSSQ